MSQEHMCSGAYDPGAEISMTLPPIYIGGALRSDFLAQIDYVRSVYQKVDITYIEHKKFLQSIFVVALRGPHELVDACVRYLQRLEVIR